MRAKSGRGRSMLRWIEAALIVGGLACTAWVYLAWRQAALFQQDKVDEMAGVLAAAERSRHMSGSFVNEPALPPNALIGLLEAPTVGLSVAVVEGDDEPVLALAVGHLPDTPLPWQEGNSALAGHRTTFFAPLERVRIGDPLRLATRHGVMEYRVRLVTVVPPTDLSVLAPGSRSSLTLITCHPFRFIGSAPNRFIVQAERVVHLGG